MKPTSISPPWKRNEPSMTKKSTPAEDILADLFSRSMKLSFNGSENRSAFRVRRAHAKKKEESESPESSWWIRNSLSLRAAAVVARK